MKLPHVVSASEYSPVIQAASRLQRLEKNMGLNSSIVDARCEMKIDIAGEPTIGTWYQIWEATLAIGSMCIRANNKGGKAIGLG